MISSIRYICNGVINTGDLFADDESRPKLKTIYFQVTVPSINAIGVIYHILMKFIYLTWINLNRNKK